MTSRTAAAALDVIVPIYKNADLARHCISTLLDNFSEIASRKPRLILVNDSPTDREVARFLADLSQTRDQIIFLRNDTNIGFVGSVNRALCLSRQERHDALLVNADTITFPSTLRNLLLAVDDDPQIGFASPRSNNASICSLPAGPGSAERSPDEALKSWQRLSKTMPLYHFTPTAVGFYMFIRSAVLANHGLLSADFGLGYEEENDLVMRAGKVGTRAVIVNHAFAYHVGSASFNLAALDLPKHREHNLVKLVDRHPEFLPLIRRYEKSPRYRAERLMEGLLPDVSGKLRIAFDLSEMGEHFNGTNEQAVAVLKTMAEQKGEQWRVTAVATQQSFECHGLAGIKGLNREEPGAPGLHAVAVRLCQPFDRTHIAALAEMAPINVFTMLDTIAEDCGPLAVESPVTELWDTVAEIANGLIFISWFSEKTFINRHPKARLLPTSTQLLPTQIESYGGMAKADSCGRHILVLGNHFPHKGSEVAARIVAQAFPDIEVVALGAEDSKSANLTVWRAGLINPSRIQAMIADAKVVVLPSHAEGFGFGFMRALAAARPIVCRRIPPTEEILSTLDNVNGVWLFDSDELLAEACKSALNCRESLCSGSRGGTWGDWVNALSVFCLELTQRDDVFDRLVNRIVGVDRLQMLRTQSSGIPEAPFHVSSDRLPAAKVVDLDVLLSMEGRTFLEHAYATLLRRSIDQGGLMSYQQQLDSGVTKAQILLSLAKSPEARRLNVDVPGLDRLSELVRRERLPFLKRFFVTRF